MIGKEQLIRSKSVVFCLINIAKDLTSFDVKDFLAVIKMKCLQDALRRGFIRQLYTLIFDVYLTVIIPLTRSNQ